MSNLHHLASSKARRVEDHERPCGRFLQPVRLKRYKQGGMESVSDLVAVEEPLLLRVRGHETINFVRTPGDDLNLVAGYLLSQGLIRSHKDIERTSFMVCGESMVAQVDLHPGESIRFMGNTVRDHGSIRADSLFHLKDLFEKRQALYQSTRATHAAALYSIDGRMIAYGEDVGRHNAFDKALGQALYSDSLEDVGIAMLSSRLALELVEKASMAGIGILCGFSVATSSALEFAATRDITLVGRLRETSMNIYTNDWRIID